MFISKNEKESILAAIKTLQQDVFKLSLALSEVRPSREEKRSGRHWTDAEKIRASEHMKKLWAEKKKGESK